MDSLKQVKDFLRDLIRPIVQEAVKASIAVPETPKTKKYLSVKEVEKIYNVSSSTIYLRFKEGELTRVKNGGRTMILAQEVEDNMRKRGYAGHLPQRRLCHR